MNYMAIKDFTAEEICKIIESAKNSNVRVLKFGKLELQLETHTALPIQNQMDRPSVATPAIAPIQRPSEEIEAEKEVELDELLIENPAEFEKIIALGRSD